MAAELHDSYLKHRAERSQALAAAERHAEAFGVPAKLLLDPETVAALREQRQRQAMPAAMTAAAKPVAGAVKDLAQAGVLPQAGAARGGTGQP